MFGSHATLVVVMASAIFGLCLGEKLSNISLSNYKDVKFENCKNSNASSNVEFVKLFPCKHTPCVLRFDGTLFSLRIEFTPAEEVRHMHEKVEIGGKHLPWVYPFYMKWKVAKFSTDGREVSQDMCPSDALNSSCPLKAGAPISLTLPLHGKFEHSLVDTLTLGMVQFRFTFLHNNGKPILCFKIPVHM